MYVQRNDQGQIIGLFANQQFDDQEFVEGAMLYQPAQSVKDKLAQLDADNALTQRNLRETIMLMTEAVKQVSGGAVDLSQLPGVAKVFEVEAQAKALRSQL